MPKRSTGGAGLTRVGETRFLRDLLSVEESAQAVAVTPKETKDARALPIPAAPEFANPQLNLFQSFLCNTEEERDHLSNAIDLWDNVPRYSISRQAMTKARINGRFLEKHETTFQHKSRTYTRTIYPARVKDLDGEDRDYYPSATEELVEDALRKLAIQQQVGYFDKPNYRSGVIFTLYSLREELKKRGHSRSYHEIVLALNVLSGSIIEIHGAGEGEVISRSPYLPSLVAVSRKRLRDDPKAKWAVQFHPFVTGSIDKVTYRQFNYHLMMSHSTQLARWLHKLLVLKYTFASVTAPYDTRYSTIKRDSGLLEAYSRPRDAIAALEEALEELKKREVLMACDRTDITGPRGKLMDVVFKLIPSPDFTRDTKAASKRINDSAAALKNR
jgi:hypothetical protein